jgi:Fe-S-cluster containining protein
MTDAHRLFLFLDQARQAVCQDLRHYHPQILLCGEILPLITQGRTLAQADGLKGGAWVGAASRGRLRWLGGPELVEAVCRALSESRLDPEALAAVCARVFQTRALAGTDPATGRPGIRLETGMQGFACRQCGHCCRDLDYRREVRAEDLERWRALGREDILKWVGVFPRSGRPPAYRIWITPGTLQPAAVCPFLQPEPAARHWTCRIHDVKPAICRQYPLSRKHALMTGCPGFRPAPSAADGGPKPGQSPRQRGRRPPGRRKARRRAT